MPHKHKVLQDWVSIEKMCFGCLTETRVQEGKHAGIMNSVLPGWKAITNYKYSPLGKIWFCWNEDEDVVET